MVQTAAHRHAGMHLIGETFRTLKLTADRSDMS